MVKERMKAKERVKGREKRRGRRGGRGRKRVSIEKEKKKKHLSA